MAARDVLWLPARALLQETLELLQVFGRTQHQHVVEQLLAIVDVPLDGHLTFEKFMRLCTYDRRGWNAPRRFFYLMAEGSWGHVSLDNIMAILISLNVVVLALDKHQPDGKVPVYEDITNMLHASFTYLFAVEMFIKLCAFGPAGYCRDRLNVFDGVRALAPPAPRATPFAHGRRSPTRSRPPPSPLRTRSRPPAQVLVGAGFVELFSSGNTEGGGSSALLAFRAIRLLRLFKLAQRMKSMQEIVQILDSARHAVLTPHASPSPDP